MSGNLRKPSKSSEREREREREGEGGVVKDKKEVVKNRLPVIRRFKIQLHPNFGLNLQPLLYTEWKGG